MILNYTHAVQREKQLDTPYVLRKRSIRGPHMNGLQFSASLKKRCAVSSAEPATCTRLGRKAISQLVIQLDIQGFSKKAKNDLSEGFA